MDYDANLAAACPVELVQMVRAEDLNRPPVNRVYTESLKLTGDGRIDCINAVIAYFTPKVGAHTNPQQLSSWLGSSADFIGELPDQLRKDMRDALLRIPYQPDQAHVYFLPLIAFRIDIVEELSTRVTPDWNFSGLGRPESHTWYYYRYLAVMGVDGAYDALARKVAATRDANTVLAFLNDLAELKSIEAKAILETYRDDPRLVRSGGGSTGPLSEIVPLAIEFGVWQ